MPFETVETFTKARMPPTAKISYVRKGKDPDGKPQLSISIPTTICGTAKSKAFVLLVGSGADLGKIRIKGLTDGIKPGDGIEPHELKHAFVFRFGYVPRLGDDAFDGERKPVKKIADDEFEITVPASWFEVEAESQSEKPARRSAA